MVRRPDGHLAAGRDLAGRGAWLCRSRPECLEAALRRGAFGRALRAELEPGAADELRRALFAPGTTPGGGPGPAGSEGRRRVEERPA